jgi:hypothetical protein
MHGTIVHDHLELLFRVGEDEQDMATARVLERLSAIPRRGIELLQLTSAAAHRSNCKSARPERTITAVFVNDGRDPSCLM